VRPTRLKEFESPKSAIRSWRLGKSQTKARKFPARLGWGRALQAGTKERPSILVPLISPSQILCSWSSFTRGSNGKLVRRTAPFSWIAPTLSLTQRLEIMTQPLRKLRMKGRRIILSMAVMLPLRDIETFPSRSRGSISAASFNSVGQAYSSLDIMSTSERSHSLSQWLRKLHILLSDPYRRSSWESPFPLGRMNTYPLLGLAASIHIYYSELRVLAFLFQKSSEMIYSRNQSGLA